MAKLVYVAITSLDGYTADEAGNFDWSAPDAEVHAFVNELSRGIGTHLYGRKMYETMVYWETFDTHGQPSVPRDYALIWQGADKIVFSTTLQEVSSVRTRVERSFDPATVQRIKETSGSDLSVGGPELAGQAMAARLVDEIHLFVTPVTVGGGTAALSGRVRSTLELRGVDTFESGVVHLHYRIQQKIDG